VIVGRLIPAGGAMFLLRNIQRIALQRDEQLAASRGPCCSAVMEESCREENFADAPPKNQKSGRRSRASIQILARPKRAAREAIPGSFAISGDFVAGLYVRVGRDLATDRRTPPRRAAEGHRGGFKRRSAFALDAGAGRGARMLAGGRHMATGTAPSPATRRQLLLAHLAARHSVSPAACGLRRDGRCATARSEQAASGTSVRRRTHGHRPGAGQTADPGWVGASGEGRGGPQAGSGREGTRELADGAGGSDLAATSAAAGGTAELRGQSASTG